MDVRTIQIPKEYVPLMAYAQGQAAKAAGGFTVTIRRRMTPPALSAFRSEKRRILPSDEVRKHIADSAGRRAILG